MIEAVGHEHLVPYFGVIGQMLKTGGKAVLQAISVPDDRGGVAAMRLSIQQACVHVMSGRDLPAVGKPRGAIQTGHRHMHKQSCPRPPDAT
eukprot:362200-Chlamydomonas_euryale.AAC.6